MDEQHSLKKLKKDHHKLSERDSSATEYDSSDDQDDSDEFLDRIRKHSSYEQVMLDVTRCAGRLEHLKQVYSHRRDNDDDHYAYELAEDLTKDLEDLQSHSTDDEHSDNSDNQQDNEDQNSRSDDSVKRILRDNQSILKERLARLIVKLLIKKPDLHYYQGFHDVCLTYMTLLGYQKAFKKLDLLVDSHFKLFMQPTMNETQDFLSLIPVIVGLENGELQSFLERAEVGTIFALSWVITWFSHVISNENDVKRIFQFLEDKDPHFVLYLSASIVIWRKRELLKLEPEMSTVHHFLSQVPRKEKLPIEDLLSNSMIMYDKWPPELVKRELDNQRKAALYLQNANVISSLAYRYFGPTIANIIIPTNAKTAIIVFVLASALALQLDKMIR